MAGIAPARRATIIFYTCGIVAEEVVLAVSGAAFMKGSIFSPDQRSSV